VLDRPSNPGAEPAAVTAYSSQIQDYLKRICSAAEWDDTPMTTSRLAGLVGVSASTASEMIRKLASLGLVTHQPYGAVQLTADGRALALRMMRRHRLVESYLVAELGFTWDEVHEEAEVLEHAISELLLDRIDAKLGHPRRDPHGDPIPGPNGEIYQPQARRLSLLEPGESGVVVRISDEDPQMLRYFDSLDLMLDTPIAVVERLPFGAGTSIRLGPEGGREVAMGDVAAQSVWVATGPA
jgi:DtxR family Mn-dependent transcriptional regulator